MRIRAFIIVAPTENQWWFTLGAYWNMEIPTAHNIDRHARGFEEFIRARSWSEAFNYVNEHGITAFVASCDVRLRREWIYASIHKALFSSYKRRLVIVGGGFTSVQAMVLNKKGARLLLDNNITPPDISQVRDEDGVSLLLEPFVENHEFAEPTLCD